MSCTVLLSEKCLCPASTDVSSTSFRRRLPWPRGMKALPHSAATSDPKDCGFAWTAKDVKAVPSHNTAAFGCCWLKSVRREPFLKATPCPQSPSL